MPETNIIFCDGACSGNPGPGGWACIVSAADGTVTELGGGEPNTTNNRMEMTAAIRALEKVQASKSATQVYTDSNYLVKGITGWVFGWQKNDWKTGEGKEVANKDLWQQLISLSQAIGRTNLRWTHIPAHSGIAANERVDEIAVAFSKNTAITLYSGSKQDYSVSLEIPVGEKIEKTKPFYLSLLDGVLEKHSTWAACEARVKGKANVKFKKVSSVAEERETLGKWGVKEK